jgi:hypothetical protein
VAWCAAGSIEFDVSQVVGSSDGRHPDSAQPQQPLSTKRARNGPVWRCTAGVWCGAMTHFIVLGCAQLLRDAIATLDCGVGSSKAKCTLAYIIKKGFRQTRLQLTHPISGVVFEFINQQPPSATSPSSSDSAAAGGTAASNTDSATATAPTSSSSATASSSSSSSSSSS